MGFWRPQTKPARRNDHFYIVTWVMKDGKPKFTLLSCREAETEVQAEQIAYNLMKGRMFHIFKTDTSDIGEATRRAKGQYVYNTGDFETGTDRMSHTI